MLRIQTPLTALLFLFAMAVPHQGVESLVPPPTQEGQESSASSLNSQKSATQDPNEEERIKAEVAEIMAIRKQLGGGVSETLGDLSLEMPGAKPAQGKSEKNPPMDYESEFAEILAKRSRNPQVRQNTPNVSTELKPDWSNPNQLSGVDAVERRESIRHAARMLEEAAAALEEARVYDRADQVRATAAELWRSAR